MLTCFTVPHSQKDTLQIAYGIPLKMYVHIVPFTDFRQAIDIIIGYIHPSGVANLAVDDYDFPVVAMYGVVHPREIDRVELDNFNTPVTD